MSAIARGEVLGIPLAVSDYESVMDWMDAAVGARTPVSVSAAAVNLVMSAREDPAVMDAALVGIPHKQLGEEPGAVVTLKPGAAATEPELRAFVAERLAAFKVPTRIIFWPETLPRNANGKILKNELKKLFVTEAAT